jgi:hypothetical protein
MTTEGFTEIFKKEVNRRSIVKIDIAKEKWKFLKNVRKSQREERQNKKMLN